MASSFLPGRLEVFYTAGAMEAENRSLARNKGHAHFFSSRPIKVQREQEWREHRSS